MAQTVIIGLSGHAGSGKDTAADYLVDRYGFVKLSLADEMKRFCKTVFGFTDEQLWGSSEKRNAPDQRFADPLAWHALNCAVVQFGRAWTARIFPFSIITAYPALCEWALQLQARHHMACPEPLSPRIALQTLGTEWGRRHDVDVWVKVCMKIALTLTRRERWVYTPQLGLQPSDFKTSLTGVVIPDARFRNELVAIPYYGGQTVRLRRPGSVGSVGIANHASESEQDKIPDSAFQHIIEVADGVPNFYQQLDQLMTHLQEK